MTNDIENDVIILGAGGHAKVVAEALRKSHNMVIGCLAPDTVPGSERCGTVVLGSTKVHEDYPPDNVVLANGIGAMPGNKARWREAARMRELGYKFINVIHPAAVIAEDVTLAEGVQIMAGVVIQPGVDVGLDSIINTGVLLDHDCIIGPNCHIAPGVVCSGGVSIDSDVYVGTGSAIIQGISVGQGSVVAAGSVVFKDLTKNSRFIQKRNA